jgi:hypothetical protein
MKQAAHTKKKKKKKIPKKTKLITASDIQL